jgi:hypothetical protein
MPSSTTSHTRSSVNPTFAFDQGRSRRQEVRRIASNGADSITVRSFAPLPWRTWISMRLLSISATLRLTASEARETHSIGRRQRGARF